MSNYTPVVKCLNVRWDGRASCELCIIREHALFADLDVKKFESVLKPIEQYGFPVDALVFAQYSPATSLYIVRKGLIKLEETLHNGTPRIVRLVQPGGVAGMETLLDHGHRYDYSATTLRATELCRIPYSILRQLMDEDHQFLTSLMENWHKQLRLSEQVIVEFSTGTVRERVIRILLMLAGFVEKEGLLEINLPSIRDIAALAGVTRESVSRVIAELKRLKLLVKSGVNQVRYDEAGLRQLLEEVEDW